jgi:hypothetical protein
MATKLVESSCGCSWVFRIEDEQRLASNECMSHELAGILHELADVVVDIGAPGIADAMDVDRMREWAAEHLYMARRAQRRRDYLTARERVPLQ